MIYSKFRTLDPTDYDGRPDARDFCTHAVINKLEDLEFGVLFPAEMIFLFPTALRGPTCAFFSRYHGLSKQR